MKVSILSVLFFSAFISFSNANEVKQVELSLNSASKTVQITDQKFDPIYESQPYETTCEREVLDHTETSCSDVQSCSGGGTVCEDSPDQVCNSSGCTSISRRSCHTESESCSTSQSCSDHPVYRTESYSCTQYHDVQVGQKLVKTFYHTIEVVMEDTDLLKNQSLPLNVMVSEGSAMVKTINPFTSFLLLMESKVVSDDNSSTEEKISQRLTIKKGESGDSIKQILNGKMEKLKLTSSGIGFNLTGMSDLSKDLNISISLVQYRLIFKNRTLFEGLIQSSDLPTTVAGKDLVVSIPVEKMKIGYLNSKKHNLNVSVSLKATGLPMVNEADFSKAFQVQIQDHQEKVIPN